MLYNKFSSKVSCSIVFKLLKAKALLAENKEHVFQVNLLYLCKYKYLIFGVALERLSGDTPHPRAKKPQQHDRHWSGSCPGLKQQLWGAGLRRYPTFRTKEKPQQDGRRDKSAFRIKPYTHQRCSKGSNKPYRDWDRPVFECLLWRYGPTVGCCRGRVSGCSRPGYGISPLGH